MTELTRDEVNRYVHEKILGKCIHANVTRSDDVLLYDCLDCDKTLTQREYFNENWDCRHSEQEPKFQATRICKHCGRDDVSFGLGIRPRPNYCSDDSPRSLLNEVVAKVLPFKTIQHGHDIDKQAERITTTMLDVMNLTAEQIARACVEAWEARKDL